MIETAATHALEMINRTLDIYKMEKGEYQPALQAVDLAALLARVARQTELAFASRHIAVRVRTVGDAGCLGEPILCYSLFNNALKNAAEASPAGGAVSIEVAPGYGSLHVVIENEGKVPEARRASFFDKHAGSSKIGGTGLGTYSMRLMAQVQGGDVAMETGAGRTRLTVTLPAT
jgi:signal transduction histidine kinase